MAKLDKIVNQTGTIDKTKRSPDGNTEEVLQLWRGYGVLSDYICVGGPKRDAINNLVFGLREFKESRSKQHSFCFLVTSPPGWGKSFLAKCLAEHFDLEFLEFSIAQMAENQDLMDCFATIASVQSKTDRRTLVFIDEVNAEIQGNKVLSLLLSPLWGGTFVKDRLTLRLKPSVWMFASTSPAYDFKGGDKGSDFLSRLNGPIIELDSPSHWSEAIKQIRDELLKNNNMNPHRYKSTIYESRQYDISTKVQVDPLKTEQVYLVLALLQAEWGPIIRVERCVLQLFHDLLPINGSRSLDFFVSRFEGIQRGEVRKSNVPDVRLSAELQRHVIIPQYWPPKTEGPTRFVEIETRIR